MYYIWRYYRESILRLGSWPFGTIQKIFNWTLCWLGPTSSKFDRDGLVVPANCMNFICILNFYRKQSEKKEYKKRLRNTQSPEIVFCRLRVYFWPQRRRDGEHIQLNIPVFRNPEFEFKSRVTRPSGREWVWDCWKKNTKAV